MSLGTPIDLSKFDVPGRGRGILDIFRWSYLLRLLVRKGTATRYRNSVLGWVWSYVKPAAQFLIYYFVMGVILQFHRDVPNFAIYLFSGVVVVNLFTEAFGNATNSIVDNRALVKKIYLPRELFPVAAVVVAFIHFLPQLAILLLVCVLVGWAPSLLALGGVLLALVLVVVFALGLGLFFSGLNVRFRDAQNFVDLIKMFATWTSPVLYTWILVADALNGVPGAFYAYMSNPVTVAVELFHIGFWDGTVAEPSAAPPHFGLIILVAAILALASMVIGQIVFRHFERTFAQDL
ncbi:ABC transporter permease [Microbacterium sp. UBA837]|uniref:ABC transporter permease n=1 Tax=Microbacterium sp. UBA837 TaxID=1946956 RepID=UPI0025E0D8F5|nr:ABC transporter permease [Microbacterium sp. UBA837]